MTYPIYKIKDFCQVGDGAHASIKRENTGIMYLSSKNFKSHGLDLTNLDYINQSDYEKHFKVSKSAITTPSVNDVLLGIIGSIGVPYIVKEGDLFGISSSVAILRTQQGLDANYLFHYMKSSFFQQSVEAIKSGAAQGFLSLEMIRNLPLIAPEESLQQQIAAILTAYDDLIETNNQRIATLEAIAQQIYKEWFARLRFPNWEHTPFHHGIPDGWEVKNFDTFCTLQRGYDLPDQDIKDGIYPVIASTSIKAYHNEYKVKPPVITTGRSGSLGAVIFSHQKSWVLNTALYVKNFHNNSPYLIFYTLKNLKLENFNAGAGVPSLNRNHLQAIKINVPPKEIQNQFDKIISDIFNQKVILEESNAILQKNRNLLLPRLISGKLTLKQAEAQAI